MSDTMTAIFRNYKSLEDVTLHIREGVTALVGPTDVGKSNVIRGLRDIFYGVRGSSCVQHGKKSAEVEFHHGTDAVTLRKGAKVNQYIVRRDGMNEPVAFSGHGTAVPPLVKETLGVYEVEVDTGVGFQPTLSEQHKPLFILDESPSVIAKILGSVSGLHIVLAAIREAKNDTDTYAATRKVKDEEARVKDEQAKDHATKAKAGLTVYNAAKVCVDRHATATQKAAKLSLLAVAIRSAEADLLRSQRLAKASEEAVESVRLLEGASRAVALSAQAHNTTAKMRAAWENVRKCRAMSSTLVLLATARAAIERAEKAIPWWKRPSEQARNLVMLRGNSDALKKKLQTGATSAEVKRLLDVPVTQFPRIRAIQKIVQRLRDEAAILSVRANSAKVMSDDYKAVIEEIATHTTCPLCGQSIPEGCRGY